MRLRLLFPLLLLVLLGALKWRVDQRRAWLEEHPPISERDSALRAEAEEAASHKKAQVIIVGSGKTWQKATGGRSGEIICKERRAFQEVAATLRCSDTVEHVKPEAPGIYRDCILIQVELKDSDDSSFACKMYFYYRTNTGSYLLPPFIQLNDAEGYKIRPRFVPRFEALIARWVQRAKDGKHPKYTYRAVPAQAIKFQ